MDVRPGINGAKPTVGIRIKDVELSGCEVLNAAAGQAVREFLAEYYERFDEYDQMSFPLYYDTGTGEPATVELLRVSPEDAPSLIDETGDRGDVGRQRRKLAGTALFHFGAFLDAQWRRNDIMWGRLDGCERLLDALFPGADDKAVREGLLQEAQRMIVRDEMQPAGYDQLIDRFAEVLADRNQPTLDQAFEGLWAHLGPADSQTRRTQTARILKSVLGDDGMVDYVKRYYEVNRDLDTKTTLRTGARAVTITGQVLEEAEKRRRVSTSRTVWLTRAGRGLQTLLAISTPGSLLQAVFRHWLGLLYVFEALIVVGSMLFSSPSARSFGLTALGLTVALHLASLLAGDLIDRKRGRNRLIGRPAQRRDDRASGAGRIGALQPRYTWSGMCTRPAGRRLDPAEIMSTAVDLMRSFFRELVSIGGTVTLPNRARNKSAGMLGSRRSDDFAPRLHRRGPEGSVRSC